MFAATSLFFRRAGWMSSLCKRVQRAFPDDGASAKASCTPLLPGHRRRLTGILREKRAAKFCGHQISSYDGAPKILWLKRQDPEAYERTRHFPAGMVFTRAKTIDRDEIGAFLAKMDCSPPCNSAGKTAVSAAFTAGGAAGAGPARPSPRGNGHAGNGCRAFLRSPLALPVQGFHDRSFVVPETCQLSMCTNAAGMLFDLALLADGTPRDYGRLTGHVSGGDPAARWGEGSTLRPIF